MVLKKSFSADHFREIFLLRAQGQFDVGVRMILDGGINHRKPSYRSARIIVDCDLRIWFNVNIKWSHERSSGIYQALNADYLVLLLVLISLIRTTKFCQIVYMKVNSIYSQK